MRILMLAHRLPYPPRTGDKVRAYHVTKHLSRGHEVTLACLADEPGTESALAALCAEIPDVEIARISRVRNRLRALGALAGGGSATMRYFSSAELRARIRSRMERQAFDLVYVSSSSMAQYLPDAAGPPVIMDFVDVDSDKWLQYATRLRPYSAWIYRLEARRLRQHEVSAARRAARCLVATWQEAALLESFAAWAPTTVIPNGVDLEYFTPADRPADGATIVFTGVMDYFPNVDAVLFFCQEIFPQIRAEIPHAQFVIVGKNPSTTVRRLERVTGVRVTGEVPDVRPFLRQGVVAVAPLRIARGVQNKILEAMAMGLPVVATSKAHAGLEAEPRRDLFVEDDPRAFATAVTSLLARPDRRYEVGQAARQFVETHHGWHSSMRRLDKIVDDVARPKSVAVETACTPEGRS